MKHELLVLGKIKDKYIDQGVSEYTSRLQHYTSFGITILSEKKKGGRRAIRPEEQGRLLLSAVPKNALKIVLDSQGQHLQSEAFAKKISNWETRGVRTACYLVGGPEGHSTEVLRAADFTLSLSRMTFTHDMVRLILAEQLYRAYTILAGEKYHK